jgi:hypothetical protein
MVTVTGGSNVNVAVNVPGTSGAPNGAWTWNWDWEGAWTLPPVPGPDVAPTASSVWDWLWQSGAAGAGTSGSAATAPTTTATASSSAPYGTWTWNWTWVFADGTTWELHDTQACECAWDWDWTWDWSHQNPAAPAPTATDASTDATATDDVAAAFDPATDTGDVFQANTVSANATSTVELDTLSETEVTQSDATGETQESDIDQRLINQQQAKAMSEASQSDAWNSNFVWGVPVESVRQSNDVDATASAEATARIAQGIVQEQVGNGTTDQSVDALQWVLNSQNAVAATQTTQTRARNINEVAAPAPRSAAVAAVQQSNSAHGSATTAVATDIAQWIGQFQNAGQADSQDASATQLHINTQDGFSASQVAQSGTTNLNDLDVPLGSQATNPSVGQRNESTVTTTDSDTSTIDGWVHQAQGGVPARPGQLTEEADARQEGIVGQRNSASASANQSEILNAAGWNGVEPPPPPTDDGPGDDGPGDGGPGDGGPGDGGPGTGGPGTGGPGTGGPADGGSTGIGTGLQPGTVSGAPTAAIGSEAKASISARPGGIHRDQVVDSTQDDRFGQPFGALAPPSGPNWSLSNAPSDDSTHAPADRGPSAPPPSAPPAPTPPPPTAGAGTGPSPTKAEQAPRKAHASGTPPPLGHEDWSDSGSSSPAPAPLPGGGSGLAVLALGRYELAIPDVVGRQLSILILGRSGAFVEPLEWPG